MSFVALGAVGQNSSFNPIHADSYIEYCNNENIPSWVNGIFKEKGLDTAFSFSFHINPFYLQGDFNGDGQIDVAILVKRRADESKGMLICHYGTQETFILGAAETSIDVGDLYWVGIWHVYKKEEEAYGYRKSDLPVLRGDAIHIKKAEGHGALIYWDGNTYRLLW